MEAARKAAKNSHKKYCHRGRGINRGGNEFGTGQEFRAYSFITDIL
jgi:hypothetical protein